MATPKHIIRDRVIGAIAGVLIGFLGRVVAPEDPSWVAIASLFLGATWTMWRGRSAGLYAFIATIVGEALAARIIRERVGFVLEGAILAGLLVAGLTIITQIDILRRRARIAQRRAERLEDLNRNSVVGILDVSAEGTIVGANKSAAATFSLTPGHLIGRAHDDVGWDVVGTDGKLIDLHDLPGNYTMRHRVPSGFWGMFHSSKDDQWKPIWIGATPDSGSGGVQVMVASEDGHLTNLNDAVGIQEEAPTYRQLRVCYLDHTAKLSGGEIALARLLETIDRKAIDPWVILAEDGSLAERLRAIGIRVDIVPLSDTVLDVRKDSVQSVSESNVFFSKVGLPESVPPGNRFPVGHGKILRAVSDNNSWYALCTDGVYRVTGAGNDWFASGSKSPARPATTYRLPKSFEDDTGSTAASSGRATPPTAST